MKLTDVRESYEKVLLVEEYHNKREKLTRDKNLIGGIHKNHRECMDSLDPSNPLHRMIIDRIERGD